MLRQRIRRRAFSLAEMVVVVLILAALAGLVIPLVSKTLDTAREDATHATMRQLKDVIVNRYWIDMNGVLPGKNGYPQANDAPNDSGGRLDTLLNPNKQHHLYFLFESPQNVNPTPYDRNTRRGWNGPYLMHNGPNYVIDADTVQRGFTREYGLHGDPTVVDGWGNPIILQRTTFSSTDDRTRLISAGPNGKLDTKASDAEAIDDDIVLRLRS